MINKLERKFGKYAIKNLMKYIVILYIAGFVVQMMSSIKGVDIYSLYLSFNIDKILKGQIWRVVTFLIQAPDSSNIFFMLVSVYLYYMIGTSLENAWGSFRFNLFYFSGVLFNMLAAIIIFIVLLVWSGGIIHFTYPIGLEYIHLSMFLAFATIYSDAQVLLFFVIPVKIKYLAWFYVIIEVYSIINNFINRPKLFAVCSLILVGVSMLNFIIFFVSERKRSGKNFKNMQRKKNFERAYKNSTTSGFNTTVHKGNGGRCKAVITRHKCAVCGRTELDDDELEFRFCSKCDGNYEYCSDHLYTHTHVVREYTDYI